MHHPEIPPDCPYFEVHAPDAAYKNGCTTFRYPGFAPDVLYPAMPEITKGVIAAVAIEWWVQVWRKYEAANAGLNGDEAFAVHYAVMTACDKWRAWAKPAEVPA